MEEANQSRTGTRVLHIIRSYLLAWPASPAWLHAGSCWGVLLLAGSCLVLFLFTQLVFLPSWFGSLVITAFKLWRVIPRISIICEGSMRDVGGGM